MTFWEEFYAASKQYFLTGHDVHYFLFTDHPEVETGDDVTLVRKPFYPWPMETLRRFETFLTVREELQQYDYIYFMNGTLLPVGPVGQEIFPMNRQGLMVTLHPGYYQRPRSTYPYEKMECPGRGCSIPKENIMSPEALTGEGLKTISACAGSWRMPSGGILRTVSLPFGTMKATSINM